MILTSNQVRKETLLMRMIESGLLDPSFDLDRVPDFPSDIDPKMYVGEVPITEGGITKLPPYIWIPIEFDQIQSSRDPRVLCRWRANPSVPCHWVCGAGLIDRPLDASRFLPNSVMGFGDAMCIAVQYPVVGRCRVEQPKRLRMQAYELHGRRYVVDMEPFEQNQYHHTVGLLWDSKRHFAGNPEDLRYLHPSLVVA